MNLVWKKKKRKKSHPHIPTAFYYLESTINEICTVPFHENQVVTLKLCVFPLKTAAYSIF